MLYFKQYLYLLEFYFDISIDYTRDKLILVPFLISCSLHLYKAKTFLRAAEAINLECEDTFQHTSKKLNYSYFFTIYVRCAREATNLAGMISLQTVDLGPVLSVHLLEFIEVAFRFGDVLDRDVVSSRWHRELRRLVGNSAANRGRNWSASTGRDF